jgi:methylenetetrahydrofolate--tRNA-(uracil-5-)-methyltransferase
MIHVIGGGLAGSEAAWQAASRGVRVRVHEMRPSRPTEVHKTGCLAELVCSNSFRSDKLDNAAGLLKHEMRELGSLVMRVADEVRVPAGAALAVDRERFAARVTEEVQAHPLIEVVREEVTDVPDPAAWGGPIVIATGPLTSEPLSGRIAALVGQAHLSFYDAVSPIVLAETIDRTRVFRASRWGRSLGGTGLKTCSTTSGVRDPGASSIVEGPGAAAADSGPGAAHRVAQDSASGVAQDFSPVRQDLASGVAQDSASGVAQEADLGVAQDFIPVQQDDGDYLNCPFSAEEYARFHDALIHAESATLHDFEKEKFFEGCLPVEVMARRGPDTLRFGPMKPVGLTDPRTSRQAYAVVQLRQDNLAADHYSLVGFQTQLKRGEQARVFRLIPGLEGAEFVRFGLVHRNTYINGPAVLSATGQVRSRPGLFIAGQVSGVEGYVESAASGLLAGINAAAVSLGRAASAPPRTTAIGALAYYVSHADPARYEPSNITFGIMAPLEGLDRRLRRDRKARNEAISARAMGELREWKEGNKFGNLEI